MIFTSNILNVLLLCDNIYDDIEISDRIRQSFEELIACYHGNRLNIFNLDESVFGHLFRVFFSESLQK